MMKNDVLSATSPTFVLLIASLIKEHCNTENFLWLQQKAELINTTNDLLQTQLCFAAIPRKIEKKTLHLNADQQNKISYLLPGLYMEGWSFHRLCRLYILIQIDAAEKGQYCKLIEGLFANAEMNERADLYAALPVFSFPEYWIKCCVEGIRSNMGIVLEAIMYNNPYPAKYLQEAAWNQMVLKAFFTEKDTNRIVGLDERANSSLAKTLIDYAAERRAAKRSINVQLWRLAGKFIDETNYEIIKNLFADADEKTRFAAALACYASDYKPARQLLNTAPEIEQKIKENKLSWINISA